VCARNVIVLEVIGTFLRSSHPCLSVSASLPLCLSLTLLRPLLQPVAEARPPPQPVAEVEQDLLEKLREFGIEDAAPRLAQEGVKKLRTFARLQDR
jgi:hypothetical protein